MQNLIRYAKVFNGTKKIPSYKIILQQWDGKMKMWIEVPTVWQSEEDEYAYKQAKRFEELNSPR